MTERASRKGRTAIANMWSRRQKRLGAVLALGVLLVPSLTTSAAFQDMTSLLDGKGAESRWQAYFVPSPAGSIEAAKLAFADPSHQDRLPAGSGIRSASGEVYTLDTVRNAFETPDEARVNRREKGGRVIAVTPVAPPKGFSAGSILERQSLLRPAAGIDGAEVRTAFVKPDKAGREIQLAMNFEPNRPPVLDAVPEAEATVMTASLRPAESRTKPAAATLSALGYAPAAQPAENGRLAKLFGRILKPARKGFIPPIGRKDHAWAATPLPKSAYSKKEQACLANGIYFEARGESLTGQAAVAQVILNRVRNPTYPNTICGVVYQNKSWRNRCQFSFACDGIKDRIFNKRAFAKARTIASQVTSGEIWLSDVGSSTHYHATYVSPRWAKAMEKVDTIGRHIFYRTYGGGWN